MATLPTLTILSLTLALTLTFPALLSPTHACPGANTAFKTSILHGAKAVLDGNWVPTMNSTLPSPNLYPHQWSWDASFVSIGYSHYDTRKAIDETDALFRGQWRNGAVPHIVFNPSAVQSYFPGPAFWRLDTAGERGPANAFTSGIIQPPVHALASLATYENAPVDSRPLALQHLVEIYPKLAAWHDYLYRERDPLRRGLVFIRHMWESGMDNSPAWDPILDAIKLKEGDVPPYKRVDKGKVGDHNERPNEFFYDRAVHLIKVFYDNEYDEGRIFEKSPFLVEDVLFNSILARAGVALGRIADILGKTGEGRAHRERADWTAGAITDKLYDEEDGFFYDYDLVGRRHIKTRISGGLVGIFGAKVEAKHVAAIVRNLYDEGFLGGDLSAWTIPSVSRDDVGYTNTTYWKGPAWININYLVRDGLLRNAGGNADAVRIGEYLRERSLELMEMSGFYEYFNPISGTPHGGHLFSWSAALAIDWVCGAGVAGEGDGKAGEGVIGRAGVMAVVALIMVAVVAVQVGRMGGRVAGGVAVATEEEEMDMDETTMGKSSGMAEDLLAHGGMRLRARPGRRVDGRSVRT